MKQTKYRLNTLLDLDIAMRLKAYAGFRGLTLAKALEKLLQKPLVQIVKTKKNRFELDLKKIHALEREVLKEYKEGKTILISTEEDLKKHFKEIDRAVDE